ncbi:MAG: DsbA family protein [Gammaproteobacteria bacterium]|jgi:2-hydroxychromene-2-carboxylate isomerase|tara:strand:- start:531 stop:1175 length:645 start_codon:yes stop_codon:yes gene_type:complete
MKIDFYFSYRSPYSYLILPRVLDLKNNYKIDINFKLVYPLAIREPEFFKGKNFLTYFFYKIRDMRSVAKQLDMPFFTPRPDPIKQSYLTGKIADEQPYIFDLCHIGQQAAQEGLGIEIAYELSSLIFGTKGGWNEESTLDKAFAKVGLNYSSLKSKTKTNENELIEQIKKNQEDQKIAGHHGVPLLVYKNQTFFGQDNFDACKALLLSDGLSKV